MQASRFNGGKFFDSPFQCSFKKWVQFTKKSMEGSGKDTHLCEFYRSTFNQQSKDWQLIEDTLRCFIMIKLHRTTEKTNIVSLDSCSSQHTVLQWQP